jgi:hypothetical protein
MRLPRVLYVVLIVLIVACGSAASARAQDQEPPSLLGGSVKAVIFDPTTYAPAALLYQSMLLDWKSSQPFFRNGFVEDNPRYTVNGLGHDVPVSYQVGKRRILSDALAVVPVMLVNNASAQLIERALIRRFPNHQKALRVLGWMERISFSTYASYQLSAGHFRQWQANQRLAGQLGY